MAELIGRTIGKYLLTERVGRGGIAAVYKAYQPALERYVAVKLLHPSVATDEEFLARFQREAKAAASLRHPHIVQIFDFGHQEELYYMVMELIDGPTLRDELQRLKALDETLPFNEVQRIVGEVSEALDYAHDRGIIHRDVKPANILLTSEGQAVLSDFGLAFMIESPQQTITGFVGTPEYMSPEQGRGLAVDGRTDVYSLGLVLYEMLTSRVPFSANTPMAIVMKHISEPLLPPRLVNPDIPAGVEQVLLKALSKNPDDRYQTAGEMVQALQYALGTVPLPQSPYDRIIATLSSYFRNVESLGKGGIFSTYKAFHPSLRRYVAIHVLSPSMIKSQGFTSDFEREVNALASFSHPNIVQTIDFGYKDDVYYIVTDLIHGSTLQTELQKLRESNKTMTLPQVIGIFEVLCVALEYAYSYKMPHLDIKPTNIVLTDDGKVFLADLGTANIAKASRQTISGPFWATPAYMSPEQCLGEVGDKRSDIYALGVILFEMMTGRVPYESDSPTGVFNMHINDPLPLARQFNPGVPEKVEAVILKAMLKDPESRYQTAGQMSEALQRAATDSQPLGIDEEDITLDQTLASLQRQLAVHKGNLNKLVEQKAIYAVGEEPLHLLNQIEVEEVEVARIEAELKRLEG